MTRALSFLLPLGLILAGALLIAADKPVTPLPAAIETMDGRIRVSYWAKPDEHKAYKFLIDLNAQHNGVIYREDTSTYTPTNGFQVFIENQFKNWHNLRLVTERNAEIQATTQEMQDITDDDVRKVRAIVKLMRTASTNPPPATPGQ